MKWKTALAELELGELAPIVGFLTTWGRMFRNTLRPHMLLAG